MVGRKRVSEILIKSSITFPFHYKRESKEETGISALTKHQQNLITSITGLAETGRTIKPLTVRQLKVLFSTIWPGQLLETFTNYA